MTLYAAVTDDQLETIRYMEDSAEALGRRLGMSRENVYRHIRLGTVCRQGLRLIRIEMEDEDEEDLF